MEPTQELVDEIYRAKVRAAREMTPEQRFLAGPRLFEWACEITRSGIRAQHPDASEEQVQEMLLRRLEIARRLEART